MKDIQVEFYIENENSDFANQLQSKHCTADIAFSHSLLVVNTAETLSMISEISALLLG